MAVDGDIGAPAPETAEHRQRRDIARALRNALKLGGSLLTTQGIGLALRLFVIPRFLGPERLGVLTTADALTAVAFVALNLGLDVYVRKEVAVRPQHASEFIGGVIVVRAVMTVFIFLGMEVFLRATHRSMEVRHLVYIYGIGQFFQNGNETSSGLLHAKGNVNELSVLSVVMKVLWGGAIIAAILFKLDLWAFAVAYMGSEAIKSTVLFALATRHLDMTFRVDLKAVRRVVLSALPFYLSTVSTMVYARFDMSALAVLSNSNKEAGYYSNAYTLASMTLALTPLISWVLIPLLARAAAVSHDEMMALVRRSAELILTVTTPVALMMAAGADVWIRIAAGAQYAPAAPALAIRAVALLIMYVSIVCWCGLTMLNRTWVIPVITLIGLVVNPLLNFALIPPIYARIGPGGGGIACATATVGTEICVLIPMLYLLGRQFVDARLVRVIVKSFGSAILIYAVDRLLKRWIGVYRLPIDLLGYVLLILTTRAVDVRETIDWTREILKRRKAGPEVVPLSSG